MKKILLWIVGIIVVLGVIGAMSGGNKTSNNTSNTSTNSTNNQKQPTESPKMAGLNETVQDGDLAFTVTKVDTAKTLGNQYTKKDSQGMFYVVTVKIENKGKKTATFDSSMAKVTDAEGREFERSIDGQTAKGMEQGKVDLFLQQVQPGLSATGDLVFDLPETVSNPVLVLKGSYFSKGVQVALK